MTVHVSDFKGKYVITGTIRCVTGLHIGGSDIGIEIGGIENPVIKDPVSDRPYIPGSSIKGKLRSLTEWSCGLIAEHSSHSGYAAYECPELKGLREDADDESRWDRAYVLARLYGPASAETEIRQAAGPTRLTFRDAFLTQASADELQSMLGERLYTEVKTENTIDRVTSEAMPRPMERVPAGGEFAFTSFLDVYSEDDRALLKTLFGTMAMLEDTALGGGGSRGHGQIAFRDLRVAWRPVAYYTEGASEKEISVAAGKDCRTLAAEFDAAQWV